MPTATSHSVQEAGGQRRLEGAADPSSSSSLLLVGHTKLSGNTSGQTEEKQDPRNLVNEVLCYLV